MNYSGRARVSSRFPEAIGVCDRCKFRYNLVDLNWQYDWAGPQIINTRLRVCRTCMDEPSPWKRSILIPPDPLPVSDPRPEDRNAANTDYRATELLDRRVTEDDSPRIVEPNGDDMLDVLEGF